MLCRDEYHKALRIPIFLLALTVGELYAFLIVLLEMTHQFVVTVFATISIRIAIINAVGDSNRALGTAINILQGSSIVSTLLTNMAATSIITHMAWYARIHSQDADSEFEVAGATDS